MLLLSVSCVFAQKIYVDRIETDGRRQVMVTTKEYSVDDKDFNFCLKVLRVQTEGIGCCLFLRMLQCQWNLCCC